MCSLLQIRKISLSPGVSEVFPRFRATRLKLWWYHVLQVMGQSLTSLEVNMKFKNIKIIHFSSSIGLNFYTHFKTKNKSNPIKIKPFPTFLSLDLNTPSYFIHETYFENKAFGYVYQNFYYHSKVGERKIVLKNCHYLVIFLFLPYSYTIFIF